MFYGWVASGVGVLQSEAKPRGTGGLAPWRVARRPVPAARGHAVDAERSAGPPAARDASFEELFRSYAEDVARLCGRMLGFGSAADDAAQEVFLRARRGFDRYDAAQPFRRWLLSVTGNHCIDQLRRRSRESRLFDPSELDGDDLADPGVSPLRLVLDEERRAQLLAALDALPHRYRLPLVLRYFHELDYDAIAEILDATRSQVGVLLFRARRRLREQLDGGAS